MKGRDAGWRLFCSGLRWRGSEMAGGFSPHAGREMGLWG